MTAPLDWPHAALVIFVTTDVAPLCTVMTILVVVPHCPAVGVKVYTLDPTTDVLMTVGFQDPVIGGVFVDEVGNTSGVSFWQYGPNCVNKGTGGAVIETLMVVTDAH